MTAAVVAALAGLVGVLWQAVRLRGCQADLARALADVRRLTAEVEVLRSELLSRAAVHIDRVGRLQAEVERGARAVAAAEERLRRAAARSPEVAGDLLEEALAGGRR